MRRGSDGKTAQEIDLIAAAIRAVDQEIGRTSISPKKRLDPITKAVEQDPDVIASSKEFTGDPTVATSSRVFRSRS